MLPRLLALLLLPLIPLLKAKAIEPSEIVIDAKSGMTGAGRAAKEAMLFSEVSEGFNAYGVGKHRHIEGRQLGRCSRIQRSGSTRRAIEQAVVMHDDLAIARQVHVELEAVGAGRQSAIERRDRVFRSDPAAAAMREDKRPIGGKRGMHAGSLLEIG